MSEKFFGFADYAGMRDQFYPEQTWSAWSEDNRYPEGQPDETFPTEDQIVFAWYDIADYSGLALVVYERDGKLYEVNGSHCSCYGLEGQWAPAETSREALGMRKVEYADYESFGPEMSREELAVYRGLFPKFEPRP